MVTDVNFERAFFHAVSNWLWCMLCYDLYPNEIGVDIGESDWRRELHLICLEEKERRSVKTNN